METAIQLAENEILVLRDVCADMTSYGGFVWPASGHVEAPDWQDTDKCGHGLHGLPWGCGGDYRIGGGGAKWLVVKVSIADGNYRHGSGEMRDKCKFRCGDVVMCGSREDAVSLIACYAPANSSINWCAQFTQADRSTQTAGDGSTQTAGENSTQVQYWWDYSGNYRQTCRMVGKDASGKAYRCVSGEWVLVTEGCGLVK